MPRRTVTPEILSEMARLNSGGLTYSEVGRRLKWSTQTVQEHLARTGVGVNNYRISADEKAEFVRLYLKAGSFDAASRLAGRSDGTIARAVRAAGVPVKSRSQAVRTYRLNDAAFESDSPACRYWLGFVMADGFVSRPGAKPQVLEVQVATRDAAHLSRLKHFLETDCPLRVVSPRGFSKVAMIRLTVNSTPLAASLRSRGITHRKTFTGRVPPGLTWDPAFWRGMIDGDGWVSRTVRGDRTHPVVGLTGTRAVCRSFLQWVKSLTPTQATVCRNHSIYRVAVFGSHAAAILRVIYRDRGERLARKYAVATPFLTRDWF